MRSFLGGATALLATMVLGCDRDPPPIPADTVALVGGRPITRAHLDRQLQRLPPELRARYAQPANRAELLESLVGTELLALEAERLKLDEDPEYKQRVKQELVRQLLQYTLDPATTPGTVPDEEVERHYRAQAGERPGDGRLEAEIKQQIRQRLAHEARGRQMEAMLAETRARFKVEILDPQLTPKSPISPMTLPGQLAGLLD
jgi:hypothetical protein